MGSGKWAEEGSERVSKIKEAKTWGEDSEKDTDQCGSIFRESQPREAQQA